MKYLVYGLGITGQSTLKTLKAMGISAAGYDNDSVKMERCREMGFDVANEDDFLSHNGQVIIKSPGITPHNPLILNANKRNIPIVSDLEMVTKLFPDKEIISITGTNGKTTCSTLVHFILTKSNLKSALMGNIGIGMLWELYRHSDNEINIIEASSFQLHDTYNYRPHIGALINIKEDHLDWHKDFDEYIQDKFKIFNNQNSLDFAIINIDDPLINKLKSQIPSKRISISLFNSDADYFYNNKKLYFRGELIADLNIDHLPLKGEHNLLNIIIAVAICSIYHVHPQNAIEILETFPGIPHRLEYVRTLNGISFYNDSKGTNPDSTIKAVNSLDDIILIAGGYDKKIDLNPLFRVLEKNVKGLVLMGQTKEIFYNKALEFNMKNIKLVNNMKNAINEAYHMAQQGDNILLSPASASWGMYRNFEERGEHFKRIVNQLR